MQSEELKFNIELSVSLFVVTLTFFLYVSVGNKTVSTRGPEIRVTNVVISIV